jgi:hypothetical protein
MFFTGKQTHGGAGEEPCWRLFIGAVNTPVGVAIKGFNQTYLQVKDDVNYGAYKPITEYAGHDEDHSDATWYPESPLIRNRGGKKFFDIAEILGSPSNIDRSKVLSSTVPMYTNLRKELGAIWARRDAVLKSDAVARMRQAVLKK